MIAEYNFKPIASFICSNYENYAICDAQFDVEETSGAELFEAFIKENDKEKLSKLEKKTEYIFTFNDCSYIVSVLPHYKTKRLIDGFILMAEATNEQVMLPFVGNEKGVLSKSLHKTQESINTIIKINSRLRELNQELASNKLAIGLLESDAEATRTHIEMLNLFTLFNSSTAYEDFEISKLFSAVKAEFVKKIGVVGRDIDVTLTPEYAFIRVIPEQFVSAVANSIHFLFKTSPRRHHVEAEILADDKSCIFRFTAKRSPSANEYASSNTTFPLLLEKTIGGDCFGKPEVEVKKSKTIITLTLPRIYRPRKESLESKIYDKISESGSLLNLLADSILDDEQ